MSARCGLIHNRSFGACETTRDFVLSYHTEPPITNPLETWYIQQGRVALETSSSEGYGVSRGFGLHTVNLTKRETTGGNSVWEVGHMLALESVQGDRVIPFTGAQHFPATVRPRASESIPHA